jgi:hypothetical protein
MTNTFTTMHSSRRVLAGLEKNLQVRLRPEADCCNHQ